jgi:gliding motility-associated-like protein
MPAFTLPFANTGSTVNCLVNAQVQPIPPSTVIDQCGNPIVPTVTTPANIACEGTITYTYNYEDCASNPFAWTYTYTIDIPVFAISYADGSSTVACPADAVDPGSPGPVTDACGNVLVAVVTPPSMVGCIGGTMDWIYTYTDCASNSDSWVYTYTVAMPAFTLPFANTGSTVNCLVNAQVQPIPPSTVNDQCGNPIVPTVTTPANIACEGTMDWIFTYTDCASNTLNWTYTYTIDLPSLIMPNNDVQNLECVNDIVVPTAPQVMDVCGNNIVPVMTENADPSCSGNKVYTFTYTDCAGIAMDYTFTYIIDDIIVPTASNPVTITVPGGPAPAVDILVVIDEADNCSVPVVAFVSESSDNAPCPETITRIYSVTDACGNSINVTHTILITDAFMPTASNPITVNVECIGDVPVPDILVVTDEADNQGVPAVAFVSDVTDGLSCPETITRTYSVTDLCGNIITVSQLIIVQDITAPTASNPVTINLAVGTSIPNPDVLVVTDEIDNCSVNLTVTFVSDLSDGLSCPETVSRTYQITDDCGNFTTVSQTIIVNSNCEIVIPTAFTPNADLSNDTWEIVDLDLIHPNNIVFVYNRWGNLLFESEKGDYLSRPWDGKVNGEQLPVASYYYVIYTEGDKSGEILNGIVSIIKN